MKCLLSSSLLLGTNRRNLALAFFFLFFFLEAVLFFLRVGNVLSVTSHSSSAFYHTHREGSWLGVAAEHTLGISQPFFTEASRGGVEVGTFSMVQLKWAESFLLKGQNLSDAVEGLC